MNPIRILTIEMPRMLHEIVEATVASQPDMILVGQIRRSENVAAAARRLRANLVIFSESQDGAGQTPWQVLDENPRLKLLAITSDGHRAIRYELRPHQMVIDGISPESLIDALRAAIAN